jgi:hypothetical protein
MQLDKITFAYSFLLDKQGVTGSSPVSPILIYKELGQVTGEAILKFVTIL